MKIGYFVLNIVGSFLGFIILTALAKYVVWENIPEQYDLWGTIFGILIVCFGVGYIGFLNAKLAPKNNFKQSFYLHFILMFFLSVTDMIFGESELYIALLRNLAYLVILQFGAYIFVKKTYPKNEIFGRDC